MASTSAVGQTPTAARKIGSVADSVGKLDLDQYRAQAAEDMANCAIHSDPGEFLSELLPWPPDTPIPERSFTKDNPFKTLENADNLREDEVTDLLVTTNPMTIQPPLTCISG